MQFGNWLGRPITHQHTNASSGKLRLGDQGQCQNQSGKREGRTVHQAGDARVLIARRELSLPPPRVQLRPIPSPKCFQLASLFITQVRPH